jgi:hypothetical protein
LTSIDNHTVATPPKPAVQPRDAATVVVLREPPVVMPFVWNDKESGRAYISLPGDPHHPLPAVPGGKIRRFQLAEGRYRKVNAN